MLKYSPTTDDGRSRLGYFYIFISDYKNDPPPPTGSIGCPHNQTGNKRTKSRNGWCQNNDGNLWTTANICYRNSFEKYILIIIYTVCTCDTLVPTRILNSEISWFCFDFPKWGPVSFIITDFNVFVQFFE